MLLLIQAPLSDNMVVKEWITYYHRRRKTITSKLLLPANAMWSDMPRRKTKSPYGWWLHGYLRLWGLNMHAFGGLWFQYDQKGTELCWKAELSYSTVECGVQYVEHLLWMRKLILSAVTWVMNQEWPSIDVMCTEVKVWYGCSQIVQRWKPV